mgnify:FL=1
MNESKKEIKINEQLKETKKSKSKNIIKILFFIIFILIIILLYSRFIGTKGLKVKEYKIVNENFTDNFYGLKIVHITDLHYGNTTNNSDLKKIVDKVNLIKPDIIVFTGDLLDKDLNNEELEEFKDILNNMKSNIKKYAVNGNHDENFSEILKETGFTDLNNNYDSLYNSNNSVILFSGINTNDDINDAIKNINNFLSDEQNTNKIIYKIMLMHEPDKILDFDYNNYDLILAGHSHNGQITIPFIGSLYKPNGSKKYYKEYYELEDTKLYISGGIGTSTLKFRLFNKPSINLYRLTSKWGI